MLVWCLLFFFYSLLLHGHRYLYYSSVSSSSSSIYIFLFSFFILFTLFAAGFYVIWVCFCDFMEKYLYVVLYTSQCTFRGIEAKTESQLALWIVKSWLKSKIILCIKILTELYFLSYWHLCSYFVCVLANGVKKKQTHIRKINFGERETDRYNKMIWLLAYCAWQTELFGPETSIKINVMEEILHCLWMRQSMCIEPMNDKRATVTENRNKRPHEPNKIYRKERKFKRDKTKMIQ